MKLKLGEECEHGNLKRSCLTCEYTYTNTELKEAYDDASTIDKKWIEKTKILESEISELRAECDKQGCRKIKYVCEDCGRVMQKVDISRPLKDLESRLSEVRAKLKGVCSDREAVFNDRDLWKDKAERYEKALIFCLGWMEPVMEGFNISKDSGAWNGLVKAKSALAQEEK